jgi:hypothetical protein
MQLWRMNETTFNFRTSGNQFVGVGASDGIIVATATTPTLPETFQIVRCPFDKNRVRIKAANGYFVQVNTYEYTYILCRVSCATKKDNPAETSLSSV